MLATKPAELTLAIEKASEVFSAIAKKPTDDDIFYIGQLLALVLMRTRYNELKNEHKFSGVILPQIRYEKIYGVGPCPIPLLVYLYDTSIATDAKRKELHQVEVANESKCNNRALYNTSNTVCSNFIMSVVKDTWF